MTSITLQGVIDENHRLIIDLPEDLPVGPVEVEIRPLLSSELTDEQVHKWLKWAGLRIDNQESEDVFEVTDADRQRLAQFFTMDKPPSQTIDE
jgi:hypothetical protein